MLVSTLDGSLHALSKQTGDLKWTLKDGEQGMAISPSLGPEYDGRGVTLTQQTRTWALETNKPVSKQLHHLPAGWPGENHCTYLSLNGLTYKMWQRVIMTPPHRILGKITLYSCHMLGFRSGTQKTIGMPPCFLMRVWRGLMLSVLYLQIPSCKDQCTSQSK